MIRNFAAFGLFVSLFHAHARAQLRYPETIPLPSYFEWYDSVSRLTGATISGYSLAYGLDLRPTSQIQKTTVFMSVDWFPADSALDFMVDKSVVRQDIFWRKFQAHLDAGAIFRQVNSAASLFPRFTSTLERDFDILEGDPLLSLC